MATSSDRFLDALRSQGQLCDDCIYPLAEFSRRQGANQLGRQLEALGAVSRDKATCFSCHRSKTVNRLTDGPDAPGVPGPVRVASLRAPVSRTWKVTPARFEECVQEFIGGTPDSRGRQADERYASFDYCFNYFQSFREAGETQLLASPSNLQASCLQLGFYLASWGMLRGSTQLLQKSARYLSPVVRLIAETEESFWRIDVDGYDDPNVELLLGQASGIRRAIGGGSDTLVTKILLGVFGCVPAFDTFFKRGFGVSTLCATALNRVAAFYSEHAELINASRVPTLDFVSGEPTQRLYTRAKIIDMAFFVHGMA